MTAKNIKNVLILGGSLAGAAVALALSKRGIAVTLVDPTLQQRHYSTGITSIQIEEVIQRLNHPDNCPRASEHLRTQALQSYEELLPHHPCTDVHKSILDQLKSSPSVEWMSNYQAVELITLDRHSLKKSDLHKRSTCVGVYVQNMQSNQIEPIFAKEIILACGGAASLYLHSNRSSYAKGAGLSMAYRAGARLNFSGQVQFSPLNVFVQSQACFPIPTDLLAIGGKILSFQRSPLQFSENLTSQIYQELCKTESEHLWMDITSIDPGLLRETYPALETYILNHGINPAKELIPIVPSIHHTPYGVVVDRLGQTSLNRLHAVGEVASVGFQHTYQSDISFIVEILTWAVSCADNISKQIEKLAYYFPEISDWPTQTHSEPLLIHQDLNLLKRIMWSYAGISADSVHKRRARGLLSELIRPYHEKEGRLLPEEVSVLNAIQAATLIAYSL